MKWHAWEVILDLHQIFPKIMVIRFWSEDSRSPVPALRSVASSLTLPAWPTLQRLITMQPKQLMQKILLQGAK